MRGYLWDEQGEHAVGMMAWMHDGQRLLGEGDGAPHAATEQFITERLARECWERHEDGTLPACFSTCPDGELVYAQRLIDAVAVDVDKGLSPHGHEHVSSFSVRGNQWTKQPWRTALARQELEFMRAVNAMTHFTRRRVWQHMEGEKQMLTGHTLSFLRVLYPAPPTPEPPEDDDEEASIGDGKEEHDPLPVTAPAAAPSAPGAGVTGAPRVVPPPTRGVSKAAAAGAR